MCLLTPGCKAPRCAEIAPFGRLELRWRQVLPISETSPLLISVYLCDLAHADEVGGERIPISLWGTAITVRRNPANRTEIHWTALRAASWNGSL